MAENVVLEEFAATVTVTGTESRELLEESAIDALEAEIPLSLTVHVLVAPEAREVGLHASELIVGIASREIVKLVELPFSAAVTVAVEEALKAPAVAVNAASVAF